MTTPTTPETGARGDRDAIQKLKATHGQLRAELAKTIVGQEEVVEQLLLAIFARGHCLLEGVPGLAKTLLVSTLARCLDLRFRRIQFTPDLMPSDITGTEVLHEEAGSGKQVFRFLKGPVFANIVLADEINRAGPKTQAALLEAMQERQVSVGGEDYALPAPFFVLATQNPIEQEGTYPLPEAQLDRFLFKIQVGYPGDDEELEIIRRVAGVEFGESSRTVARVLTGDDIAQLQEVVPRVPAADHVLRYARRLVHCTRPERSDAPEPVKKWISWGAGPRAGIYLVLAAKARAALRGEYHVACDDIAAVAPPVLRHRVLRNYAAQAEGITTDRIVADILAAVPKNEKV
jgi:MoxR-like ATPase